MFWPHLAAAAYGLGTVVVGWPCPLTRLENWARSKAGQQGLDPGGFIVLLARRPRASALGRKRHPPIADRS
ncbi:DUF2784 domain-containing protein [Thermobifida fusca]|uniref:DUF2784 domain-containing protein n=1 Tax=Thermobifida fusca TaxID=2021 RepID=UPI002227E1CA|nr:DUF2784 domain-containing protein [Thermobifida fusca]